MDNSEEGIIIVKDKTIDYINDKFLEQQLNLIQEVLLGQNNQRSPAKSFLQNLIIKIKRLYQT